MNIRKGFTPLEAGKPRAGFTLIELLVTIAIVAVLALIVLVVINPAELIRQSRDAVRLSDLTLLKKTLALYITDSSGGTFSTLSSSTIYLSLIDPTATTTLGTDCTGVGFAGSMYHCAASSTQRRVDGTGWLPLDLSSMSTRSPLSALPVDPTNTSSSGFYYALSTSPLGDYGISSLMESSKYQGVASKDAGPDPSRFEVGTSFSLMARSEGLVRQWGFDDGSGASVRDSSGNEDTGTISGSGTTWVAGKIGGALNIPTTASVSYSSSVALPTSRMTVSAWVNTSNHGNWTTFLRNNWLTGPTGTWLFFDDSSGGVLFGVSGVGGAQNDAGGCVSQFTTGAWHLLTGTYDGVNVRVYVDGTQCTSVVAFSTSLYAGGTLNTGGAIGGTYSIDDIRVYNRALSAAEISALHNATK